jgi:hypothetical protein
MLCLMRALYLHQQYLLGAVINAQNAIVCCGVAGVEKLGSDGILIPVRCGTAVRTTTVLTNSMMTRCGGAYSTVHSTVLLMWELLGASVRRIALMF